jgi:hypothetical protein
LGASNYGTSIPRLDGTAGSVELGIFDEADRRRTRGSRAHSRPSWPFSARLLVATLLALNLLLAAFLVRTEILRPAAPATSTPHKLQPPEAGSTPQLNATPDRRPSRGLKAPPVQATPAALPGTRMAKRKALSKALRIGKTRRSVLSARMPRAANYPAHQPLVPAPAPVPNPAASLRTSANVAPPGRAPSYGVPASSIPGSGIPRSAAPHSSAPAQSAFRPSAIGHSPTAKASGAGAKVAPVGLPAMAKGPLIPKKPTTSVASYFELAPRPPVKLENCGDDKVFVACPTLKIRYGTPYTSPDPE